MRRRKKARSIIHFKLLSQHSIKLFYKSKMLQDKHGFETSFCPTLKQGAITDVPRKPHTQESLHGAHLAPSTAPSCPPASAGGRSSPDLGVGSFLSPLHMHTTLCFFAVWDSHYNNKA